MHIFLYKPHNQANSASYPQRDENWVLDKWQWSSAGGSKGRYGSCHFWINVWVACKTVWSLINTCHTWAAHNKVLYKYGLLYFITLSVWFCGITCTQVHLWSNSLKIQLDAVWGCWCCRRLVLRMVRGSWHSCSKTRSASLSCRSQEIHILLPHWSFIHRAYVQSPSLHT